MSLLIDLKKLRVNEDSGKVYFTYDDLQYLPEWPDSMPIEIIRGELFVVPSPTITHQRTCRRLLFILEACLKENDVGEVFPAPVDVVLSKQNVVIPDLVFVSKENAHIITAKNIQGTPDLIIEVLSTNKKRDLVDKKQLYEQYGVKEYLILDPEEKKALLYRYDERANRFEDVRIYDETDHVTLNTIPSVKISLKDVFTE